MARQNADAPAPKKPRWYNQIWAAYKMTREVDPAVTWYLLGAFVGVLAIGFVVGLLLDNPIYWTLLSIPFAAISAMFLLTRRLDKAVFTQLEGQPGGSLRAAQMIRRGWTFEEQPVAIDARTQDLVFRGVGRPGVVLLVEGPAGRTQKLADGERKRVQRVAAGVAVTIISVGNDEGQTPLRKIPNTLRKLKPTLQKHEVSEVNKRLQALGGARLPVPKGVDPMRARPDRKGMRGR